MQWKVVVWWGAVESFDDLCGKTFFHHTSTYPFHHQSTSPPLSLPSFPHVFVLSPSTPPPPPPPLHPLPSLHQLGDGTVLLITTTRYHAAFSHLHPVLQASVDESSLYFIYSFLRSINRSSIRSIYRSSIRSINRSLIRSVNRSSIRSINRSSIRSINRSSIRFINRSSIRSINRSSIRSINRSLISSYRNLNMI